MDLDEYRPPVALILGTDEQQRTWDTFRAWLAEPSTTVRCLVRAGIMAGYRPNVPAFAATGGEWTLVEPKTRNGVTLTMHPEALDYGTEGFYFYGRTPLEEVSPSLWLMLEAMPSFVAAHNLPMGRAPWCNEAPVGIVAGWAYSSGHEPDLGRVWG